MPKQTETAKNLQNNNPNPAHFICVGTNGTGKSTAISKIVFSRAAIIFSNNWPDPGPKNRVIPPTPDIDQNEKILFNHFTKSSNCVIVVDDLPQWIAGRNSMKGFLLFILEERRKWNIDLFFTVKSFSKIPVDLMDYEPDFLIWKTTRALRGSFLEEVPDISKLRAVVDRVNDQAVKNRFYFEKFSPFK